MIRIGIIGTERSHARSFAKIINLGKKEDGSELFPDARVTVCCGPDPDSAGLVQEQAGIDSVTEKPEDLLGQVDAVMITARQGSRHYNYAKPFIEAGIPLFIDKPFAVNRLEAEKIICEAESKGVLISAGSGCKYAPDVDYLAGKRAELSRSGQFLSGSMHYTADRDEETNGLFFYGPHLTEMALAVFGCDPTSVKAFENRSGILAVLRYHTYDVSLHFTKGSQVPSCTLHATQANVHRDIDISSIYEPLMERFVTMLRTGVMPQPYHDLTENVAVLEAMEESLNTHKEVAIPSFGC